MIVVGQIRFDRDELLPKLRNPSAQTSLHLKQSRIVLHLTPSFDQIEHGLGLYQVHLPVQDRPPGELTRLRQASTHREARLQNQPGHQPTAVARDLDHVLAGITVRPREGGHERPVQEISALSFCYGS